MPPDQPDYWDRHPFDPGSGLHIRIECADQNISGDGNVIDDLLLTCVSYPGGPGASRSVIDEPLAPSVPFFVVSITLKDLVADLLSDRSNIDVERSAERTSAGYEVTPIQIGFG
jgi:hypothetical protein